MPSYRYPPLHPDAPSIRLITLLRGSGQSELRCNFKLAYLGGGEQYEAVSYAWEMSTRNRPIKVGNQTFLVSAVVEDILMRLRKPQKDRTLWLDLICIDQANRDERSRQVDRMKDIFGQAQAVIASLGPHIGSEHLDASNQWRFDHALDLITSAWRAVGSMTNFPLSESDEQNVLCLLSKPWFSRVWVVQEVAAAKKLIIICGKQTIDGKDFAKKLYQRIPSRVRQEELQTKLEHLRPLLLYMSVGFATGPKEELLTLLHQFRSWEASDPRDKVYAILGLSSDGRESSELRPDYDLPVAQVYRNVAEYMLSRYGSLAILTYAMPKQEPPPPPKPDGLMSWMWNQFQAPSNVRNVRDIPSWCPDWREAYSYSIPPEPISKPSNLRPSSPNVTPARSKLLSGRSIYCGALTVSGHLLGTVTSVLDDGSIEAIPSDETKALLKWPFAPVSRHLGKSSAALHKATGCGLKIGDCLCILRGSTGLAVLRPHDGQFHMVALEHSDFGRILPGISPESSWENVASGPAYQRSVFAEIVGKFTRDEGFTPRTRMKIRTFDLI